MTDVQHLDGLRLDELTRELPMAAEVVGDAGVRVVELVPDGDEASGPVAEDSRADATRSGAVGGIRVADTGGTYRR